MLIPINLPEDEEKRRCMSDLVKNANSKDYYNAKGFKQKYIDLMYKLGYYRNNKSLFDKE